MINVKIDANVAGLGYVMSVQSTNGNSLDDTITAANMINANIMTGEEFAYCCIALGPNHPVSQNGSRIREGIINVDRSHNKRVLIRDFASLFNPHNAVVAHSKCEEYSFGKDFDVMDRIKSVLAKDRFNINKTGVIPTKSFGEDELTMWLYGKNAKDYGLLLFDQNIHEITFYSDSTSYIKSQRHPYANQLYNEGIRHQAHILGDLRGLDSKGNIRLVQHTSGHAVVSSSPIEILVGMGQISEGTSILLLKNPIISEKHINDRYGMVVKEMNYPDV